MNVEQMNKRKINYQIDKITADFVQSRTGTQSLSMVTRKLLILWANDPEIHRRVLSMDVDNQSDYERMQGEVGDA